MIPWRSPIPSPLPVSYTHLDVYKRQHSALRMTTAAAIQNNLTFMTGLDANVVAYTIQGEVQGLSLIHI